MIGIQNTEKIGLHGEIDNHQISQYFWRALTIYPEIRYIAEENILFIYSIWHIIPLVPDTHYFTNLNEIFTSIFHHGLIKLKAAVSYFKVILLRIYMPKYVYKPIDSIWELRKPLTWDISIGFDALHLYMNNNIIFLLAYFTFNVKNWRYVSTILSHDPQTDRNFIIKENNI